MQYKGLILFIFAFSKIMCAQEVCVCKVIYDRIVINAVAIEDSWLIFFVSVK